jgi:WD40 repeat protein
VTSLSVTESGDIVSGSIDKTARVWHGATRTATLEGHEGPVLAVLALPGPEAEGGILTGSGDMLIKLWRGGKVVHTYR